MKIPCINTDQGAIPAPFAKVITTTYVAETELGTERVNGENTCYTIFGFPFGDLTEIADYGDFGPAPADQENKWMDWIDEIPILSKFMPGRLHDDMKKAATYAACKQANCDYLLDAHYVISTTVYFFMFKRIVCKVSGIPVKITGYKPLPNCEK